VPREQNGPPGSPPVNAAASTGIRAQSGQRGKSGYRPRDDTPETAD
jgi:hypothetical protein